VKVSEKFHWDQVGTRQGAHRTGMGAVGEKQFGPPSVMQTVVRLRYCNDA